MAPKRIGKLGEYDDSVKNMKIAANFLLLFLLGVAFLTEHVQIIIIGAVLFFIFTAALWQK